MINFLKNNWMLAIALIIAVYNDLLDFISIKYTSIYSTIDVVDVITLVTIIAIITFNIKSEAKPKSAYYLLAVAAFALESLSNFVDAGIETNLVPSFTIAVIIIWLSRGFGGKKKDRAELSEKQETQDRRKVIHELAESLEEEKKEKRMTTSQITTWLACIVAIVYMIFDVQTACLAQWLAGSIIAIGIIVIVVIVIVGGTALVFLKTAVPKFGKFLLHFVIALLIIFGAALLICHYKDVLTSTYGPLIDSLKAGISTVTGSGNPTVPNIGG